MCALLTAPAVDGEPSDSPERRALSTMTYTQKNQLWDAIQRFAVSCGGDPSGRVHGNTARQQAVADIEAVIRAGEASEVAAALELYQEDPHA